ncbi:putative poly(glycerol-phosphate) alpha-glucosyltransferase [Mariniflexile rhizosphaerae]|uniref:glycosyltransferase family 4 protein n=1 Tax=unclassified Mariniflexile TaxID=2643887 RepID=UPI000CCA1996|nr:glycosyltransferase family 4 protein [Mariniflexile sp. TRM1-10]AXP82464.1 putative poly(glycerol-phosphate) alpha-glucosyltransferase [Mariniflexile sp. TRM1-10]PLB18406.1 MAG: Glycosyl transferase [Flavobacteriaceae bacterium FS1-H7996/R]
MKIVFIIDQVYLHGGIERVLSIKANDLAAIKENTVYIVTSEQKDMEPCYSFNSNIVFKDLKINYNRLISYFHPKNLLKIPRHIFKLRSALNEINPDVVVVCSHSVDTYFIPFINKNIPKIKEFHFSKSIEDVHRQKSSKSMKKYFLMFADFVESKYDRLIVLNPDEATYYKTDNVVTIPNPLTFYPDTVSKLDTLVAIAAGRIAPVKQFEVLIDIWEQVHTKNKEWQLHIYGTGDTHYLEKLQKRIHDKNLNNHVFLKGPTNNIQSKMLSSSLFVMTSANECFPLVLLEAQACGLPIISFDCPNGPRNIISNDTGKLIDPMDINGFSEALLEIMANPNKRKAWGKQARIHAANYSVKDIMHQWMAMFNKLTEIKK